MLFFLLAAMLQGDPQIEQRINKAVELTRAQKIREAYDELLALSKDEPGNTRISALLAATELQIGRVKEGTARAEVLVESDPKNGDLHELLGQAYMSSRDWKKAEKEWRWLIAERPYSEQAHMQLGAVLLQTDRFEQALAEVTRSLEINPKRTDTRSLRGNILASLGKMDAAAADWNLALSQDPHDSVALAGLAVYWREREPDRALVYAHRAVDLTGGRNLGPIRVLALVLRSRGEIEQARAVLERAMLMFPNSDLLAAELKSLRASGPGSAGVPPAFLAPPARIAGLTLGAPVRDLLPLLRTPAPPTVSGRRPPLTPDPQPLIPRLPLWTIQPAFVYGDIVLPPPRKK